MAFPDDYLPGGITVTVIAIELKYFDSANQLETFIFQPTGVPQFVTSDDDNVAASVLCDISGSAQYIPQ